ncbi:hypothetical protein ACFFRR_000721 [Megaselia abdita]
MATNQHRSFGFSNNGEIEFIRLTIGDVEEAVDFLNRSYFLNESVCKAAQINEKYNTGAIQGRKELEELCRQVSKDGVTIVAKHVATNKIVSVAFNKMQFVQPGKPSFFEDFREKFCVSENSICVMDYMINMDKIVDVFEKFNIECFMEIMFLATDSNFGQKRIGFDCVKYSMDLARELSQGIGLDYINQSLIKNVPKGVGALWTSSFSAKIGKELGFHVLNTVPFKDLTFNGQTFDTRIEPVHPVSEQVFHLFSNQHN